jgi:hypothetical protein
MKHYVDFLKHKTHTSKQLGKLANTLVYEIKEKELQLAAFKESLKNIEQQINDKIEPFYTTSLEYKKDLRASIKKSFQFNNEPIANHKPVKKQKK